MVEMSRVVKAYMEKERARVVERLIIAALDVLHHDRTVGSDVDKYECDQLRQKFMAAFDEPR